MTISRNRTAKSKKPSTIPQRVLLPDWMLVAFGLIIILLMATAISAATTHNLEQGDRSGTPPLNTEFRNLLTESTLTVLPQTPVHSETSQNVGRAGVVILTPTRTATPNKTITESTPEANLPTEILLQEVPIGKQTRSLNCEFQTASDLAWYYGRPFTWEEIFQYVGHDVGGNPHKGFVGRSFDDQPGQLYPSGYGVYAEPIARAFIKLGLVAEVSYKNSREWLMAQLVSERPVMVWATSHMVIRPAVTWVASDGMTIKGVPGEHTYLVVGYDSQGVWLVDPWDGQRHHFDWQIFLASWDLLDRMALIIRDGPITPAFSP